MTRSLVSLRTGVRADAPDLADLWSTVLRRGGTAEHVADLETLIDQSEDPAQRQRLVVAVAGGEFAGAVLLRVATVSPLNFDEVVQTVSPAVLPGFRRRGIGRQLMEAAVSFADDQGVGYVMSGAPVSSRDSNRFMARIALAPHVTLRVGTVQAIRAKLRTHSDSPGNRQLSRVLAARRSQRRARDSA